MYHLRRPNLASDFFSSISRSSLELELLLFFFFLSFFVVILSFLGTEESTGVGWGIDDVAEFAAPPGGGAAASLGAAGGSDAAAAAAPPLDATAGRSVAAAAPPLDATAGRSVAAAAPSGFAGSEAAVTCLLTSHRRLEATRVPVDFFVKLSSIINVDNFWGEKTSGIYPRERLPEVMTGIGRSISELVISEKSTYSTNFLESS